MLSRVLLRHGGGAIAVHGRWRRCSSVLLVVRLFTRGRIIVLILEVGLWRPTPRGNLLILVVHIRDRSRKVCP